MKKLFHVAVAFLLGIAMLIGVTACGGNETEYSYKLSDTAITLEIGQTKQLSVTVEPEKEITVSYESSNDAIATVSEEGLVTAIAAGNATVTATVDGEALTCAVTVKTELGEEPTGPEYKLNHTNATLTEGDTLQLEVSAAEGGTVPTVTYESSKTSVATVSASGLVTAVAKGNANITAKVGGQELICTVFVNEKVVVTYELNHTEETLKAGETLQLVVSASDNSTPTVVYTSENGAIAEVTAGGLVTAKSEGNTTIKATVGTTVLECKITVEPAEEEITYSFTLNHDSAELQVNDDTLGSDMLAITVTPTPADDVTFTVVWTAEPADIVEVNGDGLTATVTALKAGNVTVKATINGQTELTCAYEVKAEVITYKYKLMKDGVEYDVENDLVLSEIDKTATFTVVSEPADSPDLENVTWSVVGSAVTVENGTITAVGIGEADVNFHIGGDMLTLHVKVETTVGASAKLNDVSTVDLTYNHETYTTLYWEQYRGYTDQWGRIAKMRASADLIETNFDDIEAGIGESWDFPIYFNWSNGDNIIKKDNFRDLVHTNENLPYVELTFKVTANTKLLRIYTGAYQAVNNISVSVGGIGLATASFQAGDGSVAKELEIAINATADSTVVVRIAPEGANISIAAAVVLGIADAPTTTATLESKELLTYLIEDKKVSQDGIFNLSDIGTQDWFMLYGQDSVGSAHESAYKKLDNSYILRNTWYGDNGNWFDDYHAAFTWNNDDANRVKETMDDNIDNATNDSICYANLRVDVKVDAQTGKMHLWVGGWDSSYRVVIFDSHGNKIFEEKIADKIGGQTQAFHVVINIDASVEETLYVYNVMDEGSNVSMPALALATK